MRLDRLFHVLVVHGGLLTAGCDDTDDDASSASADAGASRGDAASDGEDCTPP